MSIFKLTAAAAAALLVITPTVASAGTRAADSVPAVAKKGAAPVQGKAGYIRVKPKDEKVNGQSEGGGSGLVIGGLALAAVVTTVVVASDDS